VPGGYHNQARMTIQSSGTGTFALLAAVVPFNTFANAGVISGEIVPYGVIDTSVNLSEQGWGLFSSSGSSTGGPSLTRNPFTNSGVAQNFSLSAQVFIDPSAADFVQLSLAAHNSLGGL
jgi:hypothetical protein